ncbi:MAG TPA: sulfocyanin-like copper-binding protein [Gemmatimonadales bacterium]
MLSFNPRRPATILMAGVLAGGAGPACSSDTERAPRLETAASTPPSVVAASVSAPALDSAVTVDTPATPKPVAKPVAKKKATPPPAEASAAPDTAPAPAGSDQWLKYDAATNTVTFEVIGGPRGFEFNGYSNGGATLTLPPKANVVMNFINKDGTPHSAEVISGDGPIPNAAGDPAIPRAYTNKALEGLPQEASDVMKFSVPERGKYRIFCGVPGHGLSGMWIWMVVDPAAKAPSFGPTKK